MRTDRTNSDVCGIIGLRRLCRWPAGLSAVLLLTVMGGFAMWKQHFPYGWSHCCDKQLYFALLYYADAHGGVFPAGEVTPEASLSSLRRTETYVNANLLRGKSVPESAVQARLDRGQLLTPDTCGWHYVEGLRSDDDPRLALFWDKAGLNHNGGRLKGGGHFVWFTTGDRRHIPQSDWVQFENDQQKLLAQRNKNRERDE